MLKTIKALIGISQKGDATTAEIATALASACAEIDGAERARAEAARAYQDGLLSLDEAALAALVADQQAAAIRRDRATALVAALEEKLATAHAQDAEAERHTRYKAAVKAANEAARALKTYPALAAPLIALMRQVAEAEVLVNTANADLPEGAVAVESPEIRVRGLPPVPRKEVGTEIESDRWYYVGGWWDGEPVETQYQGACKPNLPLSRSGTLRRRTDNHGTMDFAVAKRRRQRTNFIPRQAAFVPDSLASGIRLPGLLPGEPDMWLAVGGSSWFGPPGASADEVLAFAKSLDGQPKAKPADPRLAPMQDWTLELLDEPWSADAAPARDAA